MLSELVYPFYSLSRSLSNSINFHHHYSAFRLIVITSVMTMSYLFKPSTRTHHSTDFPQPICVTIATDSNSSELSPNNRSILIFFPLFNLSSTTSDHRVRLTSYGTDTGYSVCVGHSSLHSREIYGLPLFKIYSLKRNPELKKMHFTSWFTPAIYLDLKIFWIP